MPLSLIMLTIKSKPISTKKSLNNNKPYNNIKSELKNLIKITYFFLLMLYKFLLKKNFFLLS